MKKKKSSTEESTIPFLPQNSIESFFIKDEVLMVKGKLEPNKHQIFKFTLIRQENYFFQKEAQKIKNALNKVFTTQNRWESNNYQDHQYFTEFLKAWVQYYQESIQSGDPHQICLIERLPINNKATDENFVFLGAEFFQDLIWTPRFESKFVQKLQEIANVHPEISLLSYLVMSLICKGNFAMSNSSFVVEEISEQQVIPYMQFFKIRLLFGFTLIFVVLIEKVPELNSSKNKIVKFQFIHTIRFLSLEKSQSEILDITKRYFKALMSDPSTKDFSEGLIPKFEKTQESLNHLFYIDNDMGTEIVKFSGLNTLAQIGTKYTPNIFEIEYLTSKESSALYFDEAINRWVSNEEELEIERTKFNQYQKQINKELLQKFADFKSASQLVNLIEKIPKFSLRLTDEEKDAIGENQNILVIGRSGTGKTTCAILRLFSIEILFKMRLTLHRIKNNEILKDSRFTSELLESSVGLHCVFVTASPVLTNEVQRYYERISANVKNQLKQKEKAEMAAKSNENMELILNESQG